MRRLNERNKSYVYFMTYKGTSPIINSDGLRTGETLPTYNPVQEARMVVGVVTGTAALEEFGISEGYAVKMVTDDVNCPLSVNDIVWLAMGKLYEYDEDTYVAGTPCIYDGGEIVKQDISTGDWQIVNYTHIVTRVAKSFGYITYLLKEVAFDFSPQPPEPTPSA